MGVGYQNQAKTQYVHSNHVCNLLMQLTRDFYASSNNQIPVDNEMQILRNLPMRYLHNRKHGLGTTSIVIR